MNYKLGSLFDGSGGFPLAGALCGIEPVWAAEVEPYPIAVTRSRFPNMKHLGDISKINGAEIEPVDIITFGSPCQDLSVAGKRAGLKHEANGDEETTRSGLFMEAVRIIKEMREATNGEYPRFALWENVPGAFSSNRGKDFRVVCEELIKIVEPAASMPEVPKNGWPYADSYIGPGFSLSYRTFDAQYWGVPQRRRRIHLVADFGGPSAREILFERKGVRGYFAEGRTPWQGAPADAQGSPGAADREGEGSGDGRGRQLDAVGLDNYNLALTGDKAATLGVNCGVSTGRNGVVYAVDQGAGKSSARVLENKSPTLDCAHGGAPAIAFHLLQDPISNGKCSPCISTGNSKAGQACLGVLQAVTFEPGAASRLGGYVWGGVAGTLRAVPGDNRLSVAYPADLILDDQGGQQVNVRTDGKAPTLRAETHGNLPAVLEPLERARARESSKHYIVRRLTPTECARLQGFADWWSYLEAVDTFGQKDYQFWLEVRNTHARINGRPEKDYTVKQMLTWYNKLWTDSAEYKMWGNGIALPPALYCMQGIVDALTAEEDDTWMQ